MKVLFIGRSKNHFSYYSSLIHTLLNENHSVLYVYDHHWSRGVNDTYINEFIESHPKLKIKEYRYNYHGFLFYIKRLVREILTLNWYGSNNNQSSYYYNRWINAIPKPFNIFIKKIPKIQWLIKKNSTARILKTIEYNLPIDTTARNIINLFSPDVTLVSPGNMRHSTEIEFLRYSNRILIPTYCLVLSWDNLTTKGIFHEKPRSLICWNKDHYNEALKYHNFSNKNLFVAGSLFFDKWHPLNTKSLSIDEIKNEIINSNNEYILWLGSSANIAKDESFIVNKFANYISLKSEGKIRVVFRAHPSNLNPNKSLSNLVIKADENLSLPDSRNARNTFSQLLNGSICTIGINTSAMIDSLILLKPSIAFLSEGYKGTQKKSLHFQSLVKYNTVYVASSLEDAVSYALNKAKIYSSIKNIKKFRENFAFPKGTEDTVGDIIGKYITKNNNEDTLLK